MFFPGRKNLSISPKGTTIRISIGHLKSRKQYTSWDDFRVRLIERISVWEKDDHKDEHSWNYYNHWMGALERLVVETGMLDERVHNPVK